MSGWIFKYEFPYLNGDRSMVQNYAAWIEGEAQALAAVTNSGRIDLGSGESLTSVGKVSDARLRGFGLTKVGEVKLVDSAF